MADTSHAKFTGMPGLRFKVWRLRPDEWFEGCYVFETDAARAAFEDTFRVNADESLVSKIVGCGPEVIEPHVVVAVAEGCEGFEASQPQ